MQGQGVGGELGQKLAKIDPVAEAMAKRSQFSIPADGSARPDHRGRLLSVDVALFN